MWWTKSKASSKVDPMTKHREKLFSVTVKDCEFQATKGSGPGGQHRNKVATAIRCTHKASGAVGYASDHKSQHRNRKLAFRRMAESKTFQDWVRLEAARVSGQLKEIENKVDKAMQESYIRTEVREDGLWQKVDVEDLEE